MAENDQESQGHDASTQPDASADKQSMLLKLAERTVVQAEALAQEITDHARQESEAEGAKIIAQASEKAKAEAEQTIENSKRRSETIISEAAAEAQDESEKTLKNSQSESEKMFTKAQSDSEKMLSKAQADSEKLLSSAKADIEANLGSTQNDVQEILSKARLEAQAIINSSQTRAESTESNARLQAEFLIRQTTQSVADGIRSSVMEICNALLPTVEEFGKDSQEALTAPEAPATEAQMLEAADSEEEHAPATNGVDAEGSDKSSGPKAKASAKKGIAAA
jgi:F0F1-type ATP synthase membrane subunit b/b'